METLQSGDRLWLMPTAADAQLEPPAADEDTPARGAPVAGAVCRRSLDTRQEQAIKPSDAKIAGLEDELKAPGELQAGLSEKLGEATGRSAELQTELAVQASELSDVTEELAGREAESAELKKAFKAAVAEQSRLQSAVASLEEKLAEANVRGAASKDTLQQMMTEMGKEVQQTKATAEGERSRAVELQSKVGELNNTIAVLRNDYNAAAESAAAEKASLEHAIKSSDAKIAGLEQSLEKANTACWAFFEDQMQTNERLQAEIDDLRRAVDHSVGRSADEPFEITFERSIQSAAYDSAGRSVDEPFEEPFADGYEGVNCEVIPFTECAREGCSSRARQNIPIKCESLMPMV